MFYPFYYDKTMLILIPAVIIAFWAQSKVSSTYRKYRQQPMAGGYTGEQVARMILDGAGLYNVPVLLTGGELSDHYDPSKRVIKLSRDIFYGNSIAAAGIAAHEVGHAIQHQKAYKPLVLRTSIATGVNVASQASMILFILGIFLSIPGLTTLGIIFFSATVFYQLITLPVEFNASSRALKNIEELNILEKSELKYSRKMLKAAAMTYVASVAAAVLEILRLLLIFGRRDD